MNTELNFLLGHVEIGLFKHQITFKIKASNQILDLA